MSKTDYISLANNYPFIAGINTKMFTAHSYRGAGLSGAKARGATINQIIAAGDWTNKNKFHPFCDEPVTNSPIGRIILNHLQSASTSCDHTSMLCFS